tara:strand:+ start:281 stop:799 length:519 start_codon:yes stop_codon:yes gene_type:complete
MKIKTLLIIIIFFIFIFFVFLKALDDTDSYIPNESLGKKITFFNAKNFFNDQIIDSNELFIENKIYLLNIWASWCVPCRKEHSILMQLSKNTSIKIIGLNYKDNLINAKKFINDMGNPYSEILRDEDGTIAIELGAYGIPETFVIDKNKIILKKFIGPLDTQSLKEIRLLIK